MSAPHSAGADLDIPRDDLLGDGPYRVVRRLAAGGMGELFVVEHRELGATFVAKVLQAEFAKQNLLLERFRVEAQSLGRLSHPHIVSVTDFGTTVDGRPYMLLEHLEGRSLADEIADRGPLPVREALTYTAQMLSALGAAHAIGIVHRDVKPSNLFLCDRPDGSRTLKVLDFGVARILPSASPVAPKPMLVPTESGAVVGTPRFVSPEGASGRRVDARADLYGVALVLYTMLVGRGPFDHIRGHMSLLSAHVVTDPLPPSHYASEPVPPELDRALLKGLAKDPGDRFQTADEFRAVLEGVSNLLVRPSGWLETSVFNPDSIAQRNRAEAYSTGQDPLDLALAALSPADDDEPEEHSTLVTSGAALARGVSRAPAKRSRAALFGVFLLGMLVASLAAAGLVTLLRGWL